MLKGRPKSTAALVLVGVWLIAFLLSDVLGLADWIGAITGAAFATAGVLAVLAFKAGEWRRS